MSAPTLTIRFPFEGNPRVEANVMTDGELDRLLDWIEAHADLQTIVELATAAVAEWRAA